MSEFECSICWEFFSGTTDDYFIRTKCGHVFHNSCIEKSIAVNSRRCPQCRTELDTKNLPLHGIDPCYRRKKFKIALLGDSGVGKSCLIQKYTNGIFFETEQATVGFDMKVKQVFIRDEEITLQICDTSGQERYQSITPQYVRDCQGVIFVFSTTDYTTLKNVGKWLDFVNHYAPNAVKILVGAKSDLNDEVDMTCCPTEAQKTLVYFIIFHGFITQARCLRSWKVKEMAEKLGMCRFETSAKNDTNVDIVFKALVEQILENKFLLRQARMQNQSKFGGRVHLTEKVPQLEPTCLC